MSVKQVTLLFALLLCSCGKEERQNVPENSSIVGEPIQSVEIDTNESQFGLIPKIDKNQTLYKTKANCVYTIKRE